MFKRNCNKRPQYKMTFRKKNPLIWKLFKLFLVFRVFGASNQNFSISKISTNSTNRLHQNPSSLSEMGIMLDLICIIIWRSLVIVTHITAGGGNLSEAVHQRGWAPLVAHSQGQATHLWTHTNIGAVPLPQTTYYNFLSSSRLSADHWAVRIWKVKAKQWPPGY